MTHLPTPRHRGNSGIRLSLRTRALIPAELADGPAFAVGCGSGVFLSQHDSSTGTAIDPASCTEVAPHLDDGYLLRGLTARRYEYPVLPHRLGGATLLEAATAILRGWSSRAHELLDATDTASISYCGLHATDPEADLTPWPTGVITDLGDAVHAMPPTGGRGAIIAIGDADALVTQLIHAHRTGSSIPLALHTYETGLADYVPAAVRESFRPVRWPRPPRSASPGEPVPRCCRRRCEQARWGRVWYRTDHAAGSRFVGAGDDDPVVA